MAITYTGTGGLFTRLGKIGAALNSVNTYRGTTLPPLHTAIEDQYNANRSYINGSASNFLSAQASLHSYLRTLQSYAVNTVIEQVNADSLQADKQLSTALAELIRQMIADSKTVSQNTVSASATAWGSNHGNGKVVFSTLELDGTTNQSILAETTKLVCTADSQTGGAVAGIESFLFSGDLPESDKLNFNWPKGSGLRRFLRAVSPSSDNSDGNLLVNSDFEAFTSNVPNQWEVAGGTPGTDILQQNSGYVGKGLDMKTTAHVRQVFNDSDGTLARLRPNTQYAFSAWYKQNTTPVSGGLVFAFHDGTGPVDDPAGNDNAVVVSLPAAGTSWTHVSGSFRTPRVISDSWTFSILTLLVASGTTVTVDHVTLTEMTQLYPGGPFMSLHSGSTPFIAGDYFTVTTANNYAAGFVQLFEKLFGMSSLGLHLPVSGSPNISDSLIA